MNQNIKPGHNGCLPTLTMTAADIEYRRAQAVALHKTDGAATLIRVAPQSGVLVFMNPLVPMKHC